MSFKEVLPSVNPPLGLEPSSVPQLVSFGFDDNGYPDGIRFVLDTFNSRRNFDSSPVLVTFFMKGDNAAGKDSHSNAQIQNSWKEAIANGNEIAVHTFSHPRGEGIDWTAEIEKCIETLEGIGAERKELTGFRTPYLEYSDTAFAAVRRAGLKYDCSIVEGWQNEQDGTNCLWPYTLGGGSPADPEIPSYPGLWELPLYTLIVPPDELCPEYGCPAGFRGRMKDAQPFFDETTGKIAGLDWNIWYGFFMSKEDALAILKYSFDLHYRGNRSPFLFGVHSDIYSNSYDIRDLEGDEPPRIKANASERRETLAEFLDYVLESRAARVTSMKNVLTWMENPVRL